MKIVTKKEENDKEFYNELLYVTTKYSRILVNPHLKMRKVTSSFLFTMLLCILSIVLLLMVYLKHNKVLILVLIILCILLLLMTLMYFIRAKMFIKEQINDSDTSTIDINKSGVRITRGKKLDYKIDWDNIKYVLINKYSISFVPLKRSYLMIGANISHKKDIIKAIKEVKKEELVIDNSDLYK